uniref:Uncharacterized protein n=1 Tax=Ananas comosus var. bracteatus TaxID=296719 RepID=A0A6V7PDW0_ANACO|nr:unnamed protein product [Ananas comosus var. bracteatus]
MSAPAPPVKKDGSCGDLEANCGSSGTATASTTRRRMVWKPLFASFFAALLLWAADTSVVRGGGGATRPPPLQLGNPSSGCPYPSPPTSHHPPLPLDGPRRGLPHRRHLHPRPRRASLPRRAVRRRDPRVLLHGIGRRRPAPQPRRRLLRGRPLRPVLEVAAPAPRPRRRLLLSAAPSRPRFRRRLQPHITLLFRSFEGLKMSPARLKYGRQLRKIPVIISRPDLSTVDGDGGASSPPALRTCRSSDFGQDSGGPGGGRGTVGRRGRVSARWTTGRYRCLAPDHRASGRGAPARWGAGERRLGLLGPLLLQDLRRGTGLGLPREQVDLLLGRLEPRRHRPEPAPLRARPRRRQAGAPAVRLQLHEPEQRLPVRPDHEHIQRPLERVHELPRTAVPGERGLPAAAVEVLSAEERVPDVMILNSGLHDGVYWRSVRAFAGGAERAAEFWAEVVGRVRERGRAAPRVFYRTTIAAGGYAREMAFNPSKMEAFDGVLLEKLKEKGLLSGVIDDFDMTFPWHYDNRCSDGVHYGRAPAKKVWRDGQIGHHYFVDLMLGHVLLNAICSD